jgi:hypothetical protein
MTSKRLKPALKTEAKSADIKPRKSNTCKVCDTKTYQKDSICVLCKTGITQMYEEMIELLKKNKEWALLETVEDICVTG